MLSLMGPVTRRPLKRGVIRSAMELSTYDYDKEKLQGRLAKLSGVVAVLKPLHKELYNLNPETFFVRSYIDAIKDNTEESFRAILSEPSPGVYTFAMFQPSFCELMLAEVEHFEKWVNYVKFKIMRSNTMNKHGAVLDDFGLETMLNKLMDEFISPISRVFYPDVGGSSLDSHHGFVVEYGRGKDVDLELPVSVVQRSGPLP